MILSKFLFCQDEILNFPNATVRSQRKSEIEVNSGNIQSGVTRLDHQQPGYKEVEGIDKPPPVQTKPTSPAQQNSPGSSKAVLRETSPVSPRAELKSFFSNPPGVCLLDSPDLEAWEFDNILHAGGGLVRNVSHFVFQCNTECFFRQRQWK